MALAAPDAMFMSGLVGKPATSPLLVLVAAAYDIVGARAAQPAAVRRETTLDDELAGYVRRAADGDRAAFTAWVRAVTPTLFRLALRLTGEASAADDVVQDAVIRAWQRLSTLRDGQASRAWACRIVRNAAVDRGRSISRRRADSLDAFRDGDGHLPAAASLAAALTDGRVAADELLVSAQTRALVRAVIDQLPEKHRLVLLLSDVDGLSQDEVAAMLDLPVGTVASRLSRAREKLARKLKGLDARQGWRFWS